MGVDTQSISGGKKPLLLNHLFLTGTLHTCLADLNEQAQSRCWCLARQMAENKGVTEDLKRQSQWERLKAINSIAKRTGEIIRSEMIDA